MPSPEAERTAGATAGSTAGDDADPGSEGVRLTIWGAGGSAPTGRAARSRFGGDTVCFEIRRLGGDAPSLIVDLGSGARDLGKALQAEAAERDRPVEAEVLLSHLHLDHIIGAPFFAPFYMPRTRLRLRCGLSEEPGMAREALHVFAAPPYFPVKPMQMCAPEWGVFRAGERFEAAGFQVTPLRLNHPGGCMGFRIETGHGDICIVGDHEHGDPEVDAGLAESVRGAALMLYDAAYDDLSYGPHRGWGHSTWRKGARLAAAREVGLTLFYHHPPEMDDDGLSSRESEIRAAFPAGRLARQGMTAILRDGVASLL